MYAHTYRQMRSERMWSLKSRQLRITLTDLSHSYSEIPFMFPFVLHILSTEFPIHAVPVLYYTALTVDLKHGENKKNRFSHI